MFTKLLPLFFILISLQAKDISTLLNEYELASDLSYKTKNESAGNLIVYTRDDLERMQAITLKDILKSMRFFSYFESRLAQPDFQNLDPISNNSKSIRLFLNNHEMLSPLGGSGFIYFGDMELDFIDHIEIYTGFPSLDFSIEPAFVIIKLYTKSAEHDEGGRIKALVGSNNSNLYNIYYSDKLQDFSYFSYLGRYDNKRKGEKHNVSNLKKDQLRERFYGSVSNEEHSIQLHAVQSRNDAFMGVNVGNTIIDNSFNYSYFNLSSRSSFLNNSLHLNASYTKIDSLYNEKYTSPQLPANSVINFENPVSEESFTLLLQKSFTLNNHTISLGAQYRYKYFDITNVQINNVPIDTPQVYNNEDIYSIYLQDLYTISSTQNFIVSIMNQQYKRNSNVDEPNNIQARMGYNYMDTNYIAKSVLSYQQFASEPYMIVSPAYGNADLISENYISATQELGYKTDTTLSNIVLMYSQLQNYPVIDYSTAKVTNNTTNLDIMSAALEFKYFFRDKDKLELNYNYSNAHALYSNDRSKISSVLIRMLNTYYGFDIFNEIIYIEGTFIPKSSIDYSSAIQYKVTKDLSLHVKGENLFNSGVEGIYLNGVTQDGKNDYVSTQIIEKKVWFGLEFLF